MFMRTWNASRLSTKWGSGVFMARNTSQVKVQSPALDRMKRHWYRCWPVSSAYDRSEADTRFKYFCHSSVFRFVSHLVLPMGGTSFSLEMEFLSAFLTPVAALAAM